MAWSEEEFPKLCYLNVQEESPVRSQAVYLIMYHWSALCWALLLHGTLKWSARDLCSWYGFISKIQVKTQPGTSRYWENISDSMVDGVVWYTENLREDTYKLLFFFLVHRVLLQVWSVFSSQLLRRALFCALWRGVLGRSSLRLTC